MEKPDQPGKTADMDVMCVINNQVSSAQGIDGGKPDGETTAGISVEWQHFNWS